MKQQPVSNPIQPTQLTPDAVALARTNKLKFRWGLISLIAPTVMIVISIIIYTIIAFIAVSMVGPVDSATPHSSQLTILSVLSFIVFLFGLVSLLLILPGIIIGTILLATRK